MEHQLVLIVFLQKKFCDVQRIYEKNMLKWKSLNF